MVQVGCEQRVPQHTLGPWGSGAGIGRLHPFEPRSSGMRRWEHPRLGHTAEQDPLSRLSCEAPGTGQEQLGWGRAHAEALRIVTEDAPIPSVPQRCGQRTLHF